MTEDEKERSDRMERNMEFMVAQQAQFAADIQKINETLARHSEALVALAGWHGRLVEAQIHLTEVQQGHDGRIAAIEAKMAEWAEAGKRTDERLDALITTVEKYISSRNGKRIGKRRGGRRAH